MLTKLTQFSPGQLVIIKNSQWINGTVIEVTSFYVKIQWDDLIEATLYYEDDLPEEKIYGTEREEI